VRSSTAAPRAARRGRATAGATGDGRGNTRGASVDRDRLLKTLFPNGIPASESVIRAVNSWLDDAERLAQMK
jgi:hypothetical protein